MRDKPTLPAEGNRIDLHKRDNLMMLLIALIPLVGILTFLSIIGFTDYSLTFPNDDNEFIPLESIVIAILLLASGFFAISTGALIINPDGGEGALLAYLLPIMLGYMALFLLAIEVSDI